jgi:ribosomal peptide maturation radical SAM protein 1
MPDVVFVVMPFADVGRPAIGVSLLEAALRAAGRSAAVEYCNIEFADRLGPSVYGAISSGMAPDMLAGEWVFAREVFGDRLPPGEDFVDRVLVTGAAPELIERIVAAREAAGAYADACAERIMAHRPRLVGFTTTFHQTCASLAVARRLKALPGAPVIVFGGANCEGEMGVQMLESFEWIDAVCCGEADHSFPAALPILLGERDGPMPGVLTRDGPLTPRRSAPVTDLDALPIPDYDEYFEALERSRECRGASVHVVVETSRGCWWGAKHHCTFCGLNGDTMTFRSKTPERAFAEIELLARRHGLRKVGCVDNILDLRYIDTLFPLLARSDLQLELFYEVKANLRHDQLVKLFEGGIRQIQPGIESFSNRVLKLMDKGVSGLQNIQLMRWCEELGIDCAYNILTGFPGEPPEEYARMAALIPLIEHLNPPMSTARLRLDRFSPFHDRAEAHGFRRVRPAHAYFHVFPLGRRELNRLAYFFDYDYEDARVPETYTEPLRRAVATWWEHREARLDAHDDGETILIEDTRAVATAPSHRLEGVAARVFAHCDQARSIVRLAHELPGAEAAVEALEADRLVTVDDGRCLSLAVFRSRPAPTRRARVAATAAA